MVYAPLDVSNFELSARDNKVMIDYVNRESMQYSCDQENPAILSIWFELWNDEAEQDFKAFLEKYGDNPITIRRTRILKYGDGHIGESEETFYDARLSKMVETHETDKLACAEIRFEIPFTSISQVQIFKREGD